MRYKATPLAVRVTPIPLQAPVPSPAPPSRGAFPRTALALCLVLSVVLVPVVTASATTALTVNPATTVAGAAVRVGGQFFAARSRGQLTFDGSIAGMPTYRASASGTFTVTVTVPATASPGVHVIAALADSRKGAAVTQVATAQVTVDPPGPTPSPGPTGGPGATASPSPSVIPTAGPTPIPTTGADPQPTFPIRAAFYYPWFPEAWNQQGYDPFSWYTPSIGYYDTAAAVASQVAAMQGAGIEAGIASWWGQGSATDARIPALLAAAGSFRWSLYYEPEGQADPTVAQLTSDLSYIVGHYGHAAGYLRIAGRPVVFVYADAADGCGMVDRWTQANAAIHAYIVLKVFSGYRTCANQPDSWHQYAPAVATDHQAGYSYSISPGFWKRSEATPRLARDLTRWGQDVAAMVASGEPWQLITTFNEWGEGTMVEDSTQFGSSYLAALAGGPVPLPTPAPTSQPTPIPTLVPTAVPTLVPTAVPTLVPTAIPTLPPTAAPTAVPTPLPTAAGGSIQHVVVVWLENEEATSITASTMPYLTGLGQAYGQATQYYAVSHPSEPNYLAFWSGSTQGVTDDGIYNLGAASLSSQMAAAGRSWRIYAQDYPTGSGCHTAATYTGGIDGPGVAGTYARKHDPAMSFTSVSTTGQCGNIQPLASFDPTVDVAFVVPNLCNDAHDCSLATADAFLRAFVPMVTGAGSWPSTLLVISWDEGSTSTNGGGRIATVVMRQGLSGVTSSVTHTHYSLLRTIQNLNGLSCLANSCGANTLAEFLP